MMLCSLQDLGLQFNSTMAYSGSIRLSQDLRLYTNNGSSSFCLKHRCRDRLCLFAVNLSRHGLRQDSSELLHKIHAPLRLVPSRCKLLLCRSTLVPAGGRDAPIMKLAALSLTRSYDAISRRPVVLQLITALGIIGFAVFGLEPLLRLSRTLFLQRTDRSWKKSSSRYIMKYSFQPLLLWTGVILICRDLDPLVLPSEASQIMKQRLLSFVRSLSTVVTFAYCSSSLIRQAQQFFMEANDSSDAKNMSIDFAGKAVYTAIWVAAVSLFLELLGFSTQKLLTAGGLGTVLLSLAGREIFTNFLSSVMLHATRPFVKNERIQTNVKGCEVSGKVEHVGWWSPTIVRGADCEAVHIPNHKLSVNVVRNLSKKSHWRIKTHLAISHLDVHKINSIVADMRKVLAKNPQVEQKKLHRRVFLEDINPENQALMILISCFVKTSHSEEYLRVKEAILLDLLRVISYHGARLATPIRTVQTMCSDTDIEIDPFDDTIFTYSRATANHPSPLIEPPNNVKLSTSVTNEDKDAKINETFTYDFKVEHDNSAVTLLPTSSVNSKDKFKPTSESKIQSMGCDNSVQRTSKSSRLRKERKGSVEKGTVPQILLTSNVSGRGESTPITSPTKQDKDKGTVPSSSVSPSLGKNIVLDAALLGSKQTLPIGETFPSVPVESREFAAQQNGSGPATKDNKDAQVSSFPTAKKRSG